MSPPQKEFAVNRILCIIKERADAAEEESRTARSEIFMDKKTKLIFINGTMGVGKTTVCRLLQQKLPNNVFLDGDDCWNMRPFLVNERTKRLVLKNITAMLNNFIGSGLFENVLFCWVMHKQSIADAILSGLKAPFDFKFFTLQCGEEQLRKRLEKDIVRDIRSPGVLERSVRRRNQYESFDTVKIDTDFLTADETAQKIAAILFAEDFSAKSFGFLNEDARMIRTEVFVREQGFEDEFDDFDAISTHLVLYYRNTPAGTCRFFREKSGDYRIGRLAVLKPLRGFGAGKRLLQFAEDEIRAAGGKRILLSAQVRAQAFYFSAGYTICGNEFLEQDVPHVPMSKLL